MKRLFEPQEEVFRKVLNGDFQRAEDHEKTWDSAFEVLSDSLLEAHSLDVRRRGRHAQRADEGQNGTWWDTAPTKCDQSVQARIIPVEDIALLHELENFPFRHDGAREVQAAVFRLARFVYFERVTEPFIRLA